MNKQKQILSTEEELVLAEQLKALAHPARLQILQSLAGGNNCRCNDFCASIPLAQSTISQHLKILNSAGIIDFKSVGNCSYYSLNPEVLSQATTTLAKLGKMFETMNMDVLPTFREHQSHPQKYPDQRVDN